MRIRFASVLVNDQQKALDFYTGVLGFAKAADIPVGEFRWLTVRSDGDAELLLEPCAFPPSKEYQKALYDAGMAAAVFTTDDLDAEVARLKSLGVRFRTERLDLGPVSVALFDDTVGNWIQLAQPKA